MSITRQFLDRVAAIYQSGIATEHSYRSVLGSLIEGLDENVTAINEPKRVACGAPDFIIQHDDLTIGHIEAKDIGVDLRALKDANRDQFTRYRKALPNLIYTNCLDWDFYRNGELVASVKIAHLGSSIRQEPERFDALENLLRDFISQRPQTITKPRELAERMAAKALLVRDVLHNALIHDKDKHGSELHEQYQAFRDHLIHDIEIEEFADIYAETIAYGMFAARLHDTTLNTFSRQEALALLPKSNPFLRNLFGYIAGVNLDDRIAWIIDDLGAVFQATNLQEIMHGFGKLTGRNDPFLHFYETFLAAYNPKKRKARGVWYTPEPVVSFIVQAVDDVLKDEFKLSDGLADASKVAIDWDTGQTNKKGNAVLTKKSVHRVQILDPATGTGTFLAEVVKQIAPRILGAAEGMWSEYVERDLIPRLHGFELLMASYAMCHMKLDMILSELGYTASRVPPRLSVFLTNSLEEGEPANQTLPFAQWLTNEVKEANTIKRDMPIMCVIGNPPYNPSSKNNNPWIAAKMHDYKIGLDERKINLNDDYMKFIRLSEGFVEKNGSGIVAMITNNSYLDGTTQRVMREHLMSTFTDIDVFNLHGDIRDRQNDDSDENVFDITQGVAIVVMWKVPGRTSTTVRYTEITGKRRDKYAALKEYATLRETLSILSPTAPFFFFVPRSQQTQRQDFSIDELFILKSSGIQTKNDGVAISWTAEDRDAVIFDFENLSLEALESRYPPMKVWDTRKAKEDICSGEFERRTITYRPFDIRFTVLTRRSGGFLGRPRFDVMQHIGEDDLSLVVNKKYVGDNFSHVSVSRSLVAHGTHYLGNRGQDIVCPLYLNPDALGADRRPNFNPSIHERLETLATHPTFGRPGPLDILDYIYGVLHCSEYKRVYSEDLKSDLPRIPWPRTADEFWHVAEKGKSLRSLHLMDDASIGSVNYPLKGQGVGSVERFEYLDGKVFINSHQYFDDVPVAAWLLHFGGYQPAQKWLKDRVGRKLSYEDVKHYQRMLKVLAETDRIAAEIVMDFVGL